jgi:hypothetical protein
MSEGSAAPISAPAAAKEGFSTVQIVLGVLFILLWLLGAAALAFLKFFAGIMANDSGAVSSELHANVLVTLMGGQALTALAGIPAGLAIFWRGHRGLLIAIFATLLLGGGYIQYRAFSTFSKAATEAQP